MARIIRPIVVILFILLFPPIAYAQTDDAFAQWVAGLQQEALAAGITEQTVHAALDPVALDPRVLALDQKQPESTLTFASYAKTIVTPERIAEGKRLLKENQKVLTSIGRRYHIQPEVIVALWSLESNYGRNAGSYNIINALATLAYQGRRAAFFRNELLTTLKIMDRDRLPVTFLTGSWAGAMGQCQFMPSTYFHYAVDGDGDGVRDIWHNQTDVFASIAHYISAEGWRDDHIWGREVKLTKKIPEYRTGLDKKATLAQWQKRGVRTVQGASLPKRALKASLIRPDGVGGRAFLVYDNFGALLRWNRSTSFAAAVGLLADGIKK